MRDPLLKMVGEKIEELRTEKKISREKLEEECNLPSQSIKKIERNPSRTFDVSALCSIADFFDVDVEYLLGKQDCRRRTIADASQITGLSYEAISVLSSFGKLNQTEIDTLSAIICSPTFLQFIVQMKRYCLLDSKSKSLMNDGYPSGLTDNEVMIAAIQNSVSLMMNEVKKKTQDELVQTDKRLNAFAFVASAIINAKRDVKESEIIEALSECGLDAKKEIQAFHEYLTEFEKSEKGRE